MRLLGYVALCLATLFFQKCDNGDDNEPKALASIVIGPSSMREGAFGNYTVVLAASKPVNADFNPSTIPLWLEERDGTLMSFVQGVHMPPGTNSQTFTLMLTCQKGRVGGTATSIGSTANNPISSAGAPGHPAMVAVRFMNRRFDANDPGFIGNELPVTCTP